MRWGSRRRTTPLVLLAALITVVAGCTTADPPAPEPADAPRGDVVRGPFCDRVSPTGVEHALGDVPADSESWENGDRERLPDGTSDRVQEYGCRWTAADGTQAHAWIFAPPVTPAQARTLRRDAVDSGDGATCRRAAGAADFGAPGATVTCTLDTGNSLVELAGLFGDAWLTCGLMAPGDPSDLPARAGEWCVQVVEAARG